MSARGLLVAPARAFSSRSARSPRRSGRALFGPSNNRDKSLIMLMEATSGIEPEYTVLQTVA
jgi:hypothetical protein